MRHSTVLLVICTLACPIQFGKPATASDFGEIGPRKEGNESVSKPADELQIKLTPHAEKLGIYAQALDGDAAARNKWDQISASERTAMLSELVCGNGQIRLRTHALRELARTCISVPLQKETASNAVMALARVAVLDANASMRALARKGLAAQNGEQALQPLAGALQHAEPQVRANAAAALKDIGGPRVFEIVIEQWQQIWGGGPREYCFFGRTQSYVGDYNISGDAYEPVVRSFITGVVLDSKIVKVERDVYLVGIREIAAGNINLPQGGEPAAWAKWLNKERPRLAKEAQEKRLAAAAELAGADDE